MHFIFAESLNNESTMTGKKSLAKLALGLTLVALLCYWVDWRAGGRLVLSLNPWILFANLLLFPTALLVAALRWRMLLRPQGVNPPFGELFKGYWIGSFANNFLPSTVGGDLARIGWLHRHRRTAAVMTSIVAERLSGFLSLLACATLTSLFRPELFGDGKILGAFWIVVALTLAALILLLLGANPVARRLAGAAATGPGFRARAAHALERLAKAILCYRAHPAAFLKAVGVSLLYLLVAVTSQYCYALALNLPLSFWDVLLVTPLIYLVTLLPVSPNALGLAEGAYLFFYTQAGLGREEAFVLALLARFVQTLCSLPGGVLASRRTATP